MLIDDLDSFLLHRNILKEKVSRLRLIEDANKLKEELRTRITEVKPLACIRESLARASSYEEV